MIQNVKNSEVSLLFCGDYAPIGRIERKIESLHANDIFSTSILEIIKSVDLSFVNFECCVASNTSIPLLKKPNLKCSIDGVRLIKEAGFKVLTLANNHVKDYDVEGVHNTITVCKHYDLNYVGAGANDVEASRILYLRKSHQTIAIINCCEREFSIATNNEAGANQLNPIKQYYQIIEARNNADYVIVITHGGKEMFSLPTPRMQETFRFFIDAGADAVINHHQHCYSGYEVYKDKFIFYGLGNFCFDNEQYVNKTWNEGYMVKVVLSENISFELFPYTQCKLTPTIQLMDKDEKKTFNKRLCKLNQIIRNNADLLKANDEKMNECRLHYEVIFSPFQNRYLRALAYRNILPRFFSIKKVEAYLDYIECDSHRDFVLHMLRSVYNDLQNK